MSTSLNTPLNTSFEKKTAGEFLHQRQTKENLMSTMLHPQPSDKSQGIPS